MAAPSQLIDGFLNAPSAIRCAVSGMSREQLLARPIAGRWSTLEVVCHLADSEQAWCHRLKRTIAEDKPLLIGYDESRFTAALGYHARELSDELGAIEQMRRQLGPILKALPESAFERQAIHNERGLVTLGEMLVLETEHIHHHVSHIVAKRRALGLSDAT
jgi:hypothetical protein